MKRIGTLFLLLFGLPVQAEITKPECDELRQWASRYDQADEWRLADRYRFPGIARDEILVPLFGQPITHWSMDDFSNLNQWVNECRQGASRQRGSTADRTLVAANRAMLRVTRYVQQIGHTREQAENAVATLQGASESEGPATARALARRALDGDNVRGELRGLPREFHRPLMLLSNALELLPQSDIDGLQARLVGDATSASGDADAGSAEQPAAAKPRAKRRVAAAGRERAQPTRTAKGSPDAAKTPAPGASPAPAAADVPVSADFDLPPPPSLQAGSSVAATRMLGVYLGMPLDAAIEVVKQAGYRLEDKGGRLHKLGPAMEYWLDFAQLQKGEVESFTGEKMTQAEARAFQTRVAIQGVQSSGVSLVAFEGRVGQIIIGSNTFDSPASVRDFVHDRLGEPHKENHTVRPSWDMQWFQDPDKRGYGDTHVRISVERKHYADRVRGENVPYTRVRYTASMCNTLPKCM